MKHDHPVITLLGSNSGNNVGDAAILSGILDAVRQESPSSEFLVPTTNPSFVNSNYGRSGRVRAVNIMPWNLSFRFLGLPALRCLWKSDAALICDGIIFGKRLFNPTFNLLITLAPLAIFARLLNCRLVCYSVGIGPFPGGRGSGLAKFLMQRCDLLMMRDGESVQLARTIGVTKPVELTGDAAYLNPVSSAERGAEIARMEGIDTSHPLLGINITSYADSWVNDDGRRSSPDDLFRTIADGITIARSRTGQEFTPVVFSTHPMDLEAAKHISRLLQAPVVSNVKYLSHDMQAVMRLCSLFVGMRFHSLVLASSVSVPVVGLVYAPKVRGLLADLKCSEFALELAGLTSDGLAQTLTSAWKDRSALLLKQQSTVEAFKAGARNAVRRLFDLLASAQMVKGHAEPSQDSAAL